MLPHQISWRIDSVETLQAYHERFKEEGVPVQQEITHGNAHSIYFFDPEGNRGEVYPAYQPATWMPIPDSTEASPGWS